MPQAKDFGAHAGNAKQRIVGRDAVGVLRRRATHVDADNRAQQRLRVLTVAARIVGRAAVADAEVEHAVGPEAHRAAVVVGEGLLDLEDDQLAVWICLGAFDGEAREAGEVGSARGVPDVEVGVVGEFGIERDAEQPLFTAEYDLFAEVEHAAHGAVGSVERDAAALFGDEQAARRVAGPIAGPGEQLDRLLEAAPVQRLDEFDFFRLRPGLLRSLGGRGLLLRRRLGLLGGRFGLGDLFGDGWLGGLRRLFGSLLRLGGGRLRLIAAAADGDGRAHGGADQQRCERAHLLVGRLVAEQRGPLVDVVEDGAQAHPHADVLLGDIDQRAGQARAFVELDHGDDLRLVAGELGGGGAAGDGEGVERAGAGDFAPFEVVGERQRRVRARVEDPLIGGGRVLDAHLALAQAVPERLGALDWLRQRALRPVILCVGRCVGHWLIALQDQRDLLAHQPAVAGDERDIGVGDLVRVGAAHQLAGGRR